MAIGYSGARALTMLLKVGDGIPTSTKENVYIHTNMSDLKPILKTPFILNMIKNTNSSEGMSQFANARYYYNIKKSDATIISDEDNALVNDPRLLTAENIDVLVKQIAPKSYAKKMSGSLRDLEMNGLENTAALAISDFIEQRRIIKQESLLNQAISEAKAVQAKAEVSTATEFKDGAHVVFGSTFTTGQQIYDELRSAISAFQRYGRNSATLDYNKNLEYVLGVNKNDMIIIMNNDKASLLLGIPGLFASDSGNELFKKLNLKEVLGVPLLIDESIPNDINFMIMTTGIHGAIAYEECNPVRALEIGGKSISTAEGSATMVLDPNWTGFYRIDVTDTFKMDVIFPDLILVSTEEAAPVFRSKNKMNKNLDFEQKNIKFNKLKNESDHLSLKINNLEKEIKNNPKNVKKEVILEMKNNLQILVDKKDLIDKEINFLAKNIEEDINN